MIASPTGRCVVDLSNSMTTELSRDSHTWYFERCTILLSLDTQPIFKFSTEKEDGRIWLTHTRNACHHMQQLASEAPARKFLAYAWAASTQGGDRVGCMWDDGEEKKYLPAAFRRASYSSAVSSTSSSAIRRARFEGREACTWMRESHKRWPPGRLAHQGCKSSPPARLDPTKSAASDDVMPCRVFSPPATTYGPASDFARPLFCTI